MHPNSKDQNHIETFLTVQKGGDIVVNATSCSDAGNRIYRYKKDRMKSTLSSAGGKEGSVILVDHGFTYRCAVRARPSILCTSHHPNGIQGRALSGRGFEAHHVDQDPV
jgi:hypothetical protein